MEEHQVFEMISVWFANTYFMHIYSKSADDYNNEKFPSIEKAYRNQVESFNSSLRQTKNKHGRDNVFYPRVMNSINQQYNDHLGLNNSPSRFIDMIARCFVPEDEYVEVYKDEFQKRDIVKAIILQSVATFTVYILNEAVDDILSLELRNSKDVRVLQKKNLMLKEKFRSILYQKRNEYCALLVAGRNGVDIANPEARAMIPQEVVFRLEEKIRYLVEEKTSIIREKNELIRSQKKMVSQMRSLLERCRELESYKTKPVKPVKLVKPVKPVEVEPEDEPEDESEDESEDEPVENLKSVQDMKKTKFSGINIAPESTNKMYNTAQMDEVDVDQVENSDQDPDNSYESENSEDPENSEDDQSDVSLEDQSDLSAESE